MVVREFNNIKNSQKNINNSISLSKKEKSHLLQEIQRLQERYALNPQHLQELFAEGAQQPSEITVPISIFQQKNLGMLEALVRYLINWLHLTPKKIAHLLQRSETTIRNSYRKSRMKQETPLTVDTETTRIPLNIFATRSHAPLFALIQYLHDTLGWRFATIARALARDPRNINTTYRKYKE